MLWGARGLVQRESRARQRESGKAMQEADERRDARRLAGLARGRLLGARWLLAASALAIAWLSWVSGASPAAALIAMLIVALAAALLPRSRTESRAKTTAGEAAAEAGPSGADVIAALPDPALTFDFHGAVVDVNQETLAAFGAMPPGTLLQLRFRASAMQELIARVLAERRPAAIEHVEKGPIERAFRVSVAPIGAEGDLFLMHFRDQSETRRIDRMRADFIANASHELRTPLASIAGFIETLRGPARDDAGARERFLEIMQAQTARMARLIDDLLSLSRIEMKPYARSDEFIDLGQLVCNVADALRQIAEDNGVAFRITRPAEPLRVPGSRDELIQVFENLLENACKYGRAGRHVDVDFSRAQAGPRPEAVVTIRDYGPGIPEEHIPRVTERFYRIDDEASRTQRGTGLGLSIVKHILSRHEGRLVIRSKLGEGSAFLVHLPLD